MFSNHRLLKGAGVFLIAAGFLNRANAYYARGDYAAALDDYVHKAAPINTQ